MSLSRYCTLWILTISIVSSKDIPVVKSKGASYLNESEWPVFRREKGNGITGFIDDTYSNVTVMDEVLSGFSDDTTSDTRAGVLIDNHNPALVNEEKKHGIYIPSGIVDPNNQNEVDDYRYFDVIPIGFDDQTISEDMFDNQTISDDMMYFLMEREMVQWTDEQVRQYGNQVMRALCSSYCTLKFLEFPNGLSRHGFQCLRCSCDIGCFVFDECCLGNPRQTPETMYECENQLENSIMTEAFYVRKSVCSSNWTDDKTRDLCNAPPSCDRLPVTTEFAETYKNEYCAMWNMDNNYMKWTLEFDFIESMDNYQTVLSFIKRTFLCKTKLLLRPPKQFPYPATCDSRRVGAFIKTCNVTGRWVVHDALLEKQCLEYHTPFYHSFKQETYENMYCYLCNGNGVDIAPIIEHENIVALTAHYDPHATWRLGNEYDSYCNATWSFYNPYQNSCKTIECSHHLEYKGEECVPLNNDSKILHFMMNISSITNIRHKIKTSLKKLGIYRYIVALGVIQQNIYLHFFSHSKFQNAAKLLSLVKSNWTFGSHVTVTDYLSFNKWTKIWVMISDDVYMSCCKGDINSTDQKTITFEISDFSLCPNVVYDETEFESAENETQRLRLIDTNLTFSLEEYESYNNGKIRICVNTLKDKMNVNNSDDIEWYRKMNLYIAVTNTVMVIVSLVCLALTFITYCTFSVLRTLPAKNNMALIVCLIFAHLSLITAHFSRKGTTICKVVGVLVHYSWLSVFFWMNVCSFHMFTVFRSANVYSLPPSGHWKRLLKYFLFANGTPAIIVILVVVVSMTTTNTIGYGDKLCYLNELMFVLISTNLPLLIIIVLNIGFLGVTIFSISKASDIARASGKDRHHMKVYIKLSAFTGLFWTVEMLANFFSPHMFILISSVLNYSQGIFLFLSYVANKRVARLWLGLCRKQLVETSVTKTNSSQTKSTNA